jgi:hypothetical protein
MPNEAVPRGTKTTSLGTTFLKISDLEKWTKFTCRGLGASVCATTTGNPSNVQLAAPWFLMRTGVPTLPAAAPLAPARTLRTFGEHNGTVEDDASTPPADAVNPATMMAPAAKTRV